MVFPILALIGVTLMIVGVIGINLTRTSTRTPVTSAATEKLEVTMQLAAAQFRLGVAYGIMLRLEHPSDTTEQSRERAIAEIRTAMPNSEWTKYLEEPKP